MKPHSTNWLRVAAAAAAALLAGCMQQFIRQDANDKLRQGEYEAAIQSLERGVADYPESPILRAGLTSAKGEAVTRLIAEAAQHRSQSRFAEAERLLQRAARLDPGNERVMSLQADLAMERRAQKQLEEAQALLAAGKKDQALRSVEAALRGAPRHAGLLALHRQLESEQRLSLPNAGRLALSETRPITLDFRNAPLSVVLEAITRSSGINFILDRDVRQDNRVSVYLRQARVDDAIDLVAGTQQLARRTVDPQTVLIYPNTPEKQREHQEQVIRVFHLANADAKTTANMLRTVLRIKDPFVDERANMVVLRESPDIIALAERLVSMHDAGEAEVMLDVEILEIKTTRLTELGINFPSSVSLTALPPTGSTALTVGNLRSLNSDRIGVSVGSLLINLRREVGDFNTLANPRIRTKNREKARILIGDKVPVITSTANATGFVAETVNYLDVGLKLDVEPVVSPDDNVTIKLGLEVSTLVKEVRSPGGSLAYQIGTRNANTVLRLHDGETQLLAGLISNDDRSSANRVPGLGDLPIAGRLFSSQKDDVQRTELVLAITPRILRPAPKPDISMAEMWVGSEASTRLRQPPGRPGATAQATASSATGTIVPVPAQPAANAATAPQAAAASPGAPNVAAVTTPPAAAAPAGPARASWQGPKEAKVGEVFTATLQVESGAPVRGMPLEIAFPPELIEVVEVSEGTFLRQGDAPTSFTHAVNAGTGRIGAGSLRNDATGVNGQGSLLQLRLKAKATGAAELKVTSLRPIGIGGTVEMAPLPALKIDLK
jgi:general secretion pathway protein D